MERIGIRINVLWKLQKNTFSYNIQLSFRNEQAPCIFGRRRVLILKDALCSWLFFFFLFAVVVERRIGVTKQKYLWWWTWQVGEEWQLLEEFYTGICGCIGSTLFYFFFLIHSLGLLEKLIRNKFSYSVHTKDLVVSSNYWSFTFK